MRRPNGVLCILSSVLCVLSVMGWTPSNPQLTTQRSNQIIKPPLSLLRATVVKDSPFDPIAKETNGDDIRDDGQDISVSSLLSYTFEELSEHLGGTGKAKACWDCLRIGIDPIWYHSNPLSIPEWHLLDK